MAAESRPARSPRERGQSLIEALVALGIFSLVFGAALAALGTVSRGKGLDEGRAAAADVAANAAAELRAACEYDPVALAAVGEAAWSVLPPAPPPGGSPADGAPVTLATTVAAQQDGALVLGLSFASARSSGSTKLVLQQYAPAPGTQVFSVAATQAPSP